jgi:hypothetical protein
MMRVGPSSEQAPKHLKLHWLRARVVSVKEKGPIFRIADKIGFGINKALAVVKHLSVQDSTDFFKEVKVGKSRFKCYSKNALNYISGELPKLNIEEVWAQHKLSTKKKKGQQFTGADAVLKHRNGYQWEVFNSISA